MADRYFVERLIEDSSARLEGGEAHHLLHVMRAKPGDELTLFDGSGAEFAARIKNLGRAEVELEIVSRQVVDRELGVQLVLGTALPKGDRARWLVEKATELGIGRLVPVSTERSNERSSPAALEKLRRAVVEASKQCGRNRLMEVAQSQPLGEFLAAGGEADVRLIAHLGGERCRKVCDELFAPGSGLNSITLAIGPEGGFTSAELDAAGAHGWRAVDLGPRVLRVETAALALTAAVLQRLDERGPS